MSREHQPHEGSRRSEPKSAQLKQLEDFRQFMHECRDCQQETEPHWQFCAYCGARLSTQCPGCGTPLPPAGARSCPHCGLAIPQP